MWMTLIQGVISVDRRTTKGKPQIQHNHRFTIANNEEIRYAATTNLQNEFHNIIRPNAEAKASDGRLQLPVPQPVILVAVEGSERVHERGKPLPHRPPHSQRVLLQPHQLALIRVDEHDLQLGAAPVHAVAATGTNAGFVELDPAVLRDAAQALDQQNDLLLRGSTVQRIYKNGSSNTHHTAACK